MTRFYIEAEGGRGSSDQSMLWWRPNRRGYTYDLQQAGLYTEEEAREIEKIRETDRAWSEAEVSSYIEHRVERGVLHRLPPK